MYRKEAYTQSRDVREPAIAYHDATAAPAQQPSFPCPFPSSSPKHPAPPFDHPPAAASIAPDPAPAPGRVWWYVLYEELARRDAVIDALAERVESLERESCRRQVPTFERRKYYE